MTPGQTLRQLAEWHNAEDTELPPHEMLALAARFDAEAADLKKLRDDIHHIVQPLIGTMRYRLLAVAGVDPWELKDVPWEEIPQTPTTLPLNTLVSNANHLTRLLELVDAVLESR